jgi:aspartyl-tRNA(Asn)/glutamyl-tRNA(Gln) amidotransferase subunit C
VAVVIDEQRIRRVAHLSRLQLSDEEVRLYAEQLDHIVQYVRQLEELDVANVEPLAHPLPVTNVLREDEAREGLGVQAALGNAPQTDRDYFRVPAVLDPHAGA